MSPLGCHMLGVKRKSSRNAATSQVGQKRSSGKTDNACKTLVKEILYTNHYAEAPTAEAY